MSEMLTEMVPGQEDSSDLELLQVRASGPGGGRDGVRGPSSRGTESEEARVQPTHPGGGQRPVPGALFFILLKNVFSSL